MTINNQRSSELFGSYSAGGVWARGSYQMGGWSQGIALPDPDISARYLTKEIPSDANPAGASQYRYSNPQIDTLFGQAANGAGSGQAQGDFLQDPGGRCARSTSYLALQLHGRLGHALEGEELRADRQDAVWWLPLAGGGVGYRLTDGALPGRSIFEALPLLLLISIVLFSSSR